VPRTHHEIVPVPQSYCCTKCNDAMIDLKRGPRGTLSLASFRALCSCSLIFVCSSVSLVFNPGCCSADRRPTLSVVSAASQSMIGGADIEDLGINAVGCGHAAVDVSPRSVADFPTFLQRDEARRDPSSSINMGSQQTPFETLVRRPATRSLRVVMWAHKGRLCCLCSSIYSGHMTRRQAWRAVSPVPGCSRSD